MKNPRLQQFLLGLFLGLLVPTISFYLFFKANYWYITLSQYVQMLTLRSMLSKVLALAAIPNLLVFYLFLWTKRDDGARGVLFGTMIIGLTVAVLYFLY